MYISGIREPLLIQHTKMNARSHFTFTFEIRDHTDFKVPQLSKPEATAERNQNSIGDRMEKPGSVGQQSRPCQLEHSSCTELTSNELVC